MSPSEQVSHRYRQAEWMLAYVLVVLKGYRLYRNWGVLEGFDPALWLETFRLTYFFEPLPPARLLMGSYHPPLSYLLTRLVYDLYPHEIEVSQIVSTLAMLVTFFALRQAIKRVGWLWTVPGLALLYGGMSIPLVVWLGVETSYDPLSLMWFTLAFAISIALFWDPIPAAKWKDIKFTRKLTGLGLVFAAGLLNKYTGLMAFGLPFLIVAVRRGVLPLCRELWAPVAAAAIGIVVCFPLYYQRYYVTEGEFMPAAMEWQLPKALTIARAARDAAPLAFLKNMLRAPPVFTESRVPANDSCLHMEWLQFWAKDTYLGDESKASLAVSNVYLRGSPLLILVGTGLFVFRHRKMPKEWQHLGWIILTVAFAFFASAIAFGWKYPYWDWRIFKAKYNSPVVFWLAYAPTVLLSEAWIRESPRPWARRIEVTVLSLVIVFVLVNHLLPIY